MLAPTINTSRAQRLLHFAIPWLSDRTVTNSLDPGDAPETQFDSSVIL
jgi:hypothetical protein